MNAAVPAGPVRVSAIRPRCGETSTAKRRNGQHRRSRATKSTTSSYAVARKDSVSPSATSRISVAPSSISRRVNARCTARRSAGMAAVMDGREFASFPCRQADAPLLLTTQKCWAGNHNVKRYYGRQVTAARPADQAPRRREPRCRPRRTNINDPKARHVFRLRSWAPSFPPLSAGMLHEPARFRSTSS